MLMLWIHRNGPNIPIRVLLDSASEANFTTQAAHNRLVLKRSRISKIVSGLNEEENKVHNACEVHIKSKHSNFEINAQCLIIPKITKNLPSTRIDYDSLQISNNLKLADAEFFKTSAIDVLIGVEFFCDLLKAGKIELSGNRLILQNTEFGWVLAGSIPSIALRDQIYKQNMPNAMTCLLTTGEALNEQLEKFWRLECYDNDKVQWLPTDEKYCEQHFERTTTRANNGRFIVRSPLREKSKFIGDNREIRR